MARESRPTCKGDLVKLVQTRSCVSFQPTLALGGVGVKNRKTTVISERKKHWICGRRNRKMKTRTVGKVGAKEPRYLPKGDYGVKHKCKRTVGEGPPLKGGKKRGTYSKGFGSYDTTYSGGVVGQETNRGHK